MCMHLVEFVAEGCADHTLRLALVTASFGRRGVPLACFAASLGSVASGLPCRLLMLAGFAIPAFMAMPPRVDPITFAAISKKPCFTFGASVLLSSCYVYLFSPYLFSPNSRFDTSTLTEWASSGDRADYGPHQPFWRCFVVSHNSDWFRSAAAIVKGRAAASC